MGMANFDSDMAYQRWLDHLEAEAMIQRIIDEEAEYE